jgi:hypothetical protein
MKISRSLSLLSAAVVLALGASGARADVSGTIAGIFNSPTPSNTTYTGVGTSQFTWGKKDGTPTPNILTFTPATPFSSPLETAFKIGTLSYYNGTTESGTNPTAVNLQIGMDFIAPPAGLQTFAFTLDLDSTNNTNNAVNSADYVIFPSDYPSTEFLIGSTEYTLKITGFENVIGDGYLSSTDSGFHVEEGKTASADLYAEVTSDVTGVGSSVPEPASLAVLGLGAAGLLLRRKKA